MEAGLENNNTGNSSFDVPKLIERNMVNGFIVVVSISGLVGNGAVIWLLGFRMKRNPFTTYILNLAVADFVILVSLILISVGEILWNFNIFPPWWYSYLDEVQVFQFAYNSSQFLLTAISIDKCVSVLFPFWYRCHRPQHLSSAICAVLWVFCLLLNSLNWILPIREKKAYPVFYVFLVTIVVCLPLITISTLILFFRICFKTQQRQRRKILIVIFWSFFFFLILTFPMNIVTLLIYRTDEITDHDLVIFCYLLQEYSSLCASLNSFVNPLIYFLVGRRKRCLGRENMKRILQRVFKEEEISGEEMHYTVQTQL